MSMTVTYHVANLGEFANHLREEAKHMKDSMSGRHKKGEAARLVHRAEAFNEIAEMLDKVKIDGAADGKH